MIEAIDAVAAPDMRSTIVALALSWARRSRIPERGAAIVDFVENDLFRAAEETIGRDLALTIVEELRPIVALAAGDEVSEIRASQPVLDRTEGEESRDPVGLEPQRMLDEMEGSLPWDDEDEMLVLVDDDEPEEEEVVEEPASPPRQTDPAPALLPLVLVATSDPSRIDGLGRALGGRATVHTAPDALAILESLGASSLLVVDCQRPTIRLETLLAMAPELPSTCRVVLWGEQHDIEQRLAGFGDGLPEEWVCCGADADADDVGAVCRVLFE